MSSSKDWIEIANQRIEASRLLIKNGFLADSINRIYYACHAAVRGLLVTKSLESKSHSGVRHLFNLHYIKEDIISRDLGKIFAELYELREDSDYGILSEISKEIASQSLRDAEYFVNSIEVYLNGLR